MKVALICTVISQVQPQKSQKEQTKSTPDKQRKRERDTGREAASHESVD